MYRAVHGGASPEASSVPGLVPGLSLSTYATWPLNVILLKGAGGTFWMVYARAHSLCSGLKQGHCEV